DGAELVDDAGDGGRQRLVHRRPHRLVDQAGVLVHEDLLHLHGQAAALPGEGGVDPAGQVPAPEADVLPHVERAAADLDGAEIGGEALGQPAEAVPVEGPGAEVELGVGGRVGRRGAGPAPAVVVAVEIEDDERAT